MKTKLTIILLCILCSTAGVAQQYGWVNISNNLPSATNNLSDLFFTSSNEGWICTTDANRIYHTSDGGSSFTSQSTNYYTKAIYMLNKTTGYAGGYNGYVFKTTDGTTWTSIGSIGKTLTSISFPPASATGYCCGYGGKIYSILPSGTLSAMATSVSSNLAAISFPGSQGRVCGENVILHYNETSWLGNQSYNEGTYNGICMINHTKGWAVGSSGVILKTTDGTNWTAQTSPTTNELYDVFFLDSSNGWAVGYGGVIVHTTNGGTTWAIEGNGLTTNALRAVHFTSATNGYIVGNNGTILHYTQITGVEEHPAQPTAFNLEQNFPNPFNSETKISYSLALPAQVQLTVCNMFGQQVALLDEGFKPAGCFSADFTGDGLPSGIYYYRLQCGDRHETRKMTLIK